jgi:Fe-S cluster biogenesis protein NfuA
MIMTTPTEVYAEITPNPSTMKFVLNFLLIEEEGKSVEFRTKEKAEIYPLAKKIFEFSFVNGVFISSNFVTVTKDESCDWKDVVSEIKELIKTEVDTGEPLLSGELITEEAGVQGTISEDINQKIIALLDEYIRPAVESDGGAIHFKSFESGIVTVVLKGSCSGCPSSTITLKQGVEALLRKMLPEVEQVVTETE